MSQGLSSVSCSAGKQVWEHSQVRGPEPGIEGRIWYEPADGEHFHCLSLVFLGASLLFYFLLLVVLHFTLFQLLNWSSLARF